MLSSKAFQQVINTPLGKIGIRCHPNESDTITNIEYLSDDSQLAGNNHAATRQLHDYFATPKHKFNLTVKPAGTAFQQRVWQALCDIPSGTTLTYGELAKKLQSSPRAVGQACRKNPIPIIIPCHRVVSATGMGGYAGATDGKLMAIKQWLLAHEGN